MVIPNLKISFDLEAGWTYSDEEQTDLAGWVLEMFGWNLLDFDRWLANDSGWNGFPKNRQRMLSARQEITYIFRSRRLDTLRLPQLIRPVLIDALRVAMQCKNLPDELKESIRSSPLRATRNVVKKTDPVMESRLRAQWAQMVQSGEKYGGVKALAERYGVSITTVRKILLKS